MIKKKKSIFSTIFKLSRPKFWPYLAGPYLIGYTAMAHQIKDFLQFPFFYSLFFFLIPANIILYGINDIFDQDTDSFNPKKSINEQKVDPSNIQYYKIAIAISLILSLPLFLFLPIFAKWLFLVFLVLSIFYSAPPFRLKAKPFVDSASNILYAFPGFIAIYQLTSNGLTGQVLVAVFCWCAAMHLFSAIPDIEADKRANLRTSAIRFGHKNSLLICFGLWLIAALLAFSLNWRLVFLFIYPVVPLLLLTNTKYDINKLYWQFPYLNLIAGFVIYLIAAFV